MPAPVLYGFALSPHVRAARIAFHEKDVPITLDEIGLDRLSEDWFGEINPFRKIPALVDGEVTLFETPALLVYANAIGPGASLAPHGAAEQARMWQFIGVAQSYLYPIGIMQLYFHNVLAGLFGMEADAAVAEQAIEPVRRSLDVLEGALSGGYLAGDGLSLADIYCGAMVDYIARTRDGRRLVLERSKLAAWLDGLRERPSFTATFSPMLVGTDQK